MRILGLCLAITLTACTDGGKTDSDASGTDLADTDVADTDAADTDVADTDIADTGVADTDAVDTDLHPTPDDLDGDGSLNADDCAENDPTVRPGAAELCDGVDQDCADNSEAGRASFFPTVGAGVDLTPALSSGTEARLSGSGTVRLCGGAWTGTVFAPAGSEVTVAGEDGYDAPTFTAGGVNIVGTGNVRGLKFENATLYGGESALLTVEDTELVATNLWLRFGSSLRLTRVTARAQASTFVSTFTTAGIPNPANDITVEDSTFVDMYNPFSGDHHLTIRRTAFEGSSSVSGSQLLLEDSTFERGTFAAVGHGTETAVIRRVTVGTDSNYGSQLNHLASVTIDGLTANNRSAWYALIVADTASVSITNSDFSIDNAGGFSALRLDGGTQAEMDVTVSDCTFVGGAAATQIDVLGPTALTVTGTAFSGGDDSAIEIYNTHDVTVTDCTFDDSAAGTAIGGVVFNASGGAISAQIPGHTLTVSDSTFRDNHAASYGGAIFLNTGALVVTDSTFDGNRADGAGGAVSVWAGTAAFVDTVFDDNVAVYGGGGLAVQGGSVTVTGGRFFRNTSSAIGGAVSVGGSATFSSVVFGTGADQNTPDDIGWTGGAGGSGSYGTYTGACTSAGCP